MPEPPREPHDTEAAGATEPRHHRIAGYEILSKVGEGGMGVVFKARQLSLDRVVALKVLAPRLTQNPRFVEGFIREARAIARLSHPHIVRVYEVDRSKGGIYYYAMEFVEGESLGSLLRKGRRFDPLSCCRVVAQVAQALQHAHEHGFVHRDVKPDNVLLSAEGHAKLADLGLARHLEKRDAKESTLSSTSRVVGTPYYMPPEQAEGKPVDARSDLYALGATFYHLLTGSPPFVAESAIGVITKHLTEPRPDPCKLNPEVTPAMAGVVRRLMQVKPEDRYPDARTLVADLSSVLDPRLAGQRPASRPRGWGGAGRWLAWILAGLAVAAGVGLAFRAHANLKREREAQREFRAAEDGLERYARAAQEERLVALVECRRALERILADFPGTRAALQASKRRQEVAGALVSLGRAILTGLSSALEEAIRKPLWEPAALPNLQREWGRLARLATDSEIPLEVREEASKVSSRFRQDVAGRFADEREVAALRGVLLRRGGPAQAEAVLQALSEMVEPESPAARHLAKELSVFEKRRRGGPGGRR